MIATASKPIRKRRSERARRPRRTGSVHTKPFIYADFSPRVQVGPNLYAGYYAKRLAMDPMGLQHPLHRDESEPEYPYSDRRDAGSKTEYRVYMRPDFLRKSDLEGLPCKKEKTKAMVTATVPKLKYERNQNRVDAAATIVSEGNVRDIRAHWTTCRRRIGKAIHGGYAPDLKGNLAGNNYTGNFLFNPTLDPGEPLTINLEVVFVYCRCPDLGDTGVYVQDKISVGNSLDVRKRFKPEQKLPQSTVFQE